jgi:hypothetical protein
VNNTAVSAIRRVHLSASAASQSGIACILRARGHGLGLRPPPVTLTSVESLGVTVHEGHMAENIDERS